MFPAISRVRCAAFLYSTGRGAVRSVPAALGIGLPMWIAFGPWTALGVPVMLAVRAFFAALGEVLVEFSQSDGAFD